MISDDIPQDWERQRAFLTVLREGSISAAARALGLAQPTVRRRIEELEAQTGAALFDRSPTGLRPTELALALRDHAEAMAAASAAFLRAASAPPGEVAGTVRISANAVLADEILPQLFGPLLARHADLAIEFSTTGDEDAPLARDCDIAVRLAQPEQSGLIATRIGSLTLGLYAHRDYLKAHCTPRSAEALHDHVLIGRFPDAAILRACSSKGISVAPDQPRLRFDTSSGVLAALRAGLGIALCPEPLARRDPALVPLFTDSADLQHEIWLAYHEDLRPLARVRAVFDALADALPIRAGAPLQRLAPANWPAAPTSD
ncbi:LysR family transcriptional regulator [Sphingosinithalassobacter portus]|uniref:LysR family transcriptional regulator n=1 Tax=Stakelama portus TaxID=2676234 RepID=UPI000D6E74EE|nr:LysR family transcriptional regulator [Sphingosinithalassobacter portus]